MPIYTRLHEVRLAGGGILRPAKGEEFKCIDCPAPINGDVWREGDKIRCAPHAVIADIDTLGTRAVNRESRTIHTIVGTQSIFALVEE